MDQLAVSSFGAFMHHLCIPHDSYNLGVLRHLERVHGWKRKSNISMRTSHLMLTERVVLK